jgi:DNA-binding transcriptional LysR family regulator
VVLLQRGTRGSTLTPAGVVLVEWATRLTDVADEVAAATETLRTDRDGSCASWPA